LLIQGQVEEFPVISSSLRKIASIFLLGVLLFNWVGYRLVIGYLQVRTEHELEAKLDVKDYDESELITMKVAVTHLSYYNSYNQFERVNGSINIGGIEYKYVERRLFNDSLELRCLPDNAATKLGSCKRRGSQPLTLKMQVDPFVLADGVVPYQPYCLPAPMCGYYAGFIPSLFPFTDERPPDMALL